MNTTTENTTKTELQAVTIQRETLQRIALALHNAGVLCDAVPTRLQQHDEPQIAHIGSLVNEQGVYGQVRDADAEVRALLEQPAIVQTLSTPAFMQWLADRLVHVYGESQNVDFVLSLRSRAAELAAATAAQPVALANEGDTAALPAQAPEGWLWMTHPDRNSGQPIPVQVFTDRDGVTWYRPFDTDATDFAWASRDDEWAVVSGVPAAAPDTGGAHG